MGNVSKPSQDFQEWLESLNKHSFRLLSPGLGLGKPSTVFKEPPPPPAPKTSPNPSPLRSWEVIATAQNTSLPLQKRKAYRLWLRKYAQKALALSFDLLLVAAFSALGVVALFAFFGGISALNFQHLSGELLVILRSPEAWVCFAGLVGFYFMIFKWLVGITLGGLLWRRDPSIP